MRIQIKATNIELTPSLRDYVEKRIESLERFIQDSSEAALASVEVGKIGNHHKTGDVFRAEVNLRIDGKTVYAEVEKDDLYAAIDAMKEIAEKECLLLKQKEMTLIKRGAAKIKKLLRRAG